MRQYCKWGYWLLLVLPLQAIAANGIAIEPLQVKIKKDQIGYFYIHNETNNNYILNASIIDTDPLEEEKSKKKGIPVTISPPIYLIKSRENTRFSIIPLLKERENHNLNQYQIMVKVIPKTTQKKHFTVIPIILTLVIKLTIE